MKNYQILVLIILTFFSSCQLEDDDVQTQKTVEEEALEYSKTIVKYYFDENCSDFYNSLSSQLIILGGEGILDKHLFENDLCNSVNKAVSDNTKSLEDYLNCYNIEVLHATEVEDLVELSYYSPSVNDFYFSGYKLKEGANCENFIWDDMFIFLVSKVEGEWKCIGL